MTAPTIRPDLAPCSAVNAEGVVCGGEAYPRPDRVADTLISCLNCGAAVSHMDEDTARDMWNRLNRAHGVSAVEQVLALAEFDMYKFNGETTVRLFREGDFVVHTCPDPELAKQAALDALNDGQL